MGGRKRGVVVSLYTRTHSLEGWVLKQDKTGGGGASSMAISTRFSFPFVLSVLKLDIAASVE